MDVVEATTPIQICSGIHSGVEAAVHAVRSIFDDPNTEGVLLVDASNAFNSMNRSVALKNIQVTCPQFSTFTINTYIPHPCIAGVLQSYSYETQMKFF